MVNIFSEIINDPERRKKWMIGGGIGIAVILVIIIIIIATSGGSENPAGSDALSSVPLIDGYNNIAQLIRQGALNDLSKIKFDRDLTNDVLWGLEGKYPTYTDLIKMKEGKVRGQIWWASADCDVQYQDAVQIAMEQIDVIKRLTKKYNNDMEIVSSITGLEMARSDNKIASFIGLKGGHLLDSRLGLLRMFYDLGVRFLTLAPKCSTPWLIQTEKDTKIDEFGHKIIAEANRLGMVLDLSGLKKSLQLEILNKYTTTPFIISQAVAQKEFNVDNNDVAVDNEILAKIGANKGLVMVTFDSKSLTGDQVTKIENLLVHIDYIASVAGVDSVALGSGFGLYPKDSKPLKQMGDVSNYPYLFDQLKKYESKNKVDWNSMENLEKLASKNIQRVLARVEEISSGSSNDEPWEEWIPADLLKSVPDKNVIEVCRSTQRESKDGKL